MIESLYCPLCHREWKSITHVNNKLIRAKCMCGLSVYD